MNCKLEKFWNTIAPITVGTPIKWTVNLKSFEMKAFQKKQLIMKLWTVNLKSFEILWLDFPMLK